MPLLYLIIFAALLCPATQLSAQYVDDRASALRLRSNVTGYTLSIQPSTVTSAPYQLLFQAQSPAQSSIWTSDADQRVEWLAPGVSGNILTSNGTNLSWQHPFSIAAGWLTNGTSTSTSWEGTSGAMAGPLTAQPLSIVTRSATAQPILLFTGTNAASERMRIGSTGGVLIGTTSALANTNVTIGNVSNAGSGLNIDLDGTSLSSALVVRAIGNTATTDAGVIVGSTTNGTGTAVRVGAGTLVNAPNLGIEIASASPVVASPTTTASGTGAAIGTSVSPWQNGVEGWTSSASTQIGRAVQTDASSATASTSIGTYASAAPSVGDVYPLISTSTNNSDIYLGSSAADVPLGLSLLGLGAHTNTTRMHHLRSSGQLTFRGTGIGVTTLTAGAQGASDIIYTLPTSAPTANTTVLVAGPSGVMTWANAAGLADILMEETVSDGDLMRSPQYRKHAVMDESNIDDYSVNLSGGWSHTSGRYNGILSGDTTQIWYEPVGAAIVTGNRTYVLGCNHSAIIGGYNNIISNGISLSGGSSCFIGSGRFLSSGTGNNQAVVSGLYNACLVNGRQSTFIGTGERNGIWNSARASIVNGYDGRIYDSDDAFNGSAFNGLAGDGVRDLSHRSSVIAGAGAIRNSTDALIATSWDVSLESSANRCAVISGDRCRIELSANSTILSATDITIELSAHNSTVISGRNLTLQSGRICALGYSTSGIMTLSEQNSFVLANIPLVLASNSTPPEVRFYEGQGLSGPFPGATTNYVGLKAAAAYLNDHTYVLPTLPATSGRVLTSAPVGPDNVMSWVDVTGVWRTSGTDVNSSADEISSLNGPLVFATTNNSPQDIRFYTASSGTQEQMRIRGADGNVGVGSTNPSQKLAVHGTARLGVNGTTINGIIKTTAAVDIPNLAAGASHTEDISVNNTTVLDAVKATALGSLPDGLLIAWTRVSAAGTVSIGFVNNTSLSIDPPQVDFSILSVQ